MSYRVTRARIISYTSYGFDNVTHTNAVSCTRRRPPIHGTPVVCLLTRPS